MIELQVYMFTNGTYSNYPKTATYVKWLCL